jgi:hypothetical protein
MEDQYYEMIVIDKSWKTIWNIYHVKDDKKVGCVIMQSKDGDPLGPFTYSWYDDITDEFDHPKSLKECFKHWNITKWDKPMY